MASANPNTIKAYGTQRASFASDSMSFQMATILVA
jgi:hypothetical protein